MSEVVGLFWEIIRCLKQEILMTVFDVLKSKLGKDTCISMLEGLHDDCCLREERVAEAELSLSQKEVVEKKNVSLRCRTSMGCVGECTVCPPQKCSCTPPVVKLP